MDDNELVKVSISRSDDGPGGRVGRDEDEVDKDRCVCCCCEIDCVADWSVDWDIDWDEG